MEMGCGYIEDEDLEDLLNQIGLIKNRMLPPGEIESLSGTFPLPDLSYNRYQAAKSKAGADGLRRDILLYAHTFLEKLPGLRDRFRRRYPYINVDESQDISPVQLSVLRLLSPEGKGLFMVGDEDQSIYGFPRGQPRRDFAVYPLFPHRTGRPDGGKFPLPAGDPRPVRAVYRPLPRAVRQDPPPLPGEPAGGGRCLPPRKQFAGDGKGAGGGLPAARGRNAWYPLPE